MKVKRVVPEKAFVDIGVGDIFRYKGTFCMKIVVELGEPVTFGVVLGVESHETSEVGNLIDIDFDEKVETVSHAELRVWNGEW